MSHSVLVLLLILLILIGLGSYAAIQSTPHPTPSPTPTLVAVNQPSATPGSQLTGNKTIQIEATAPDLGTVFQSAPTPPPHVVPTLPPSCIYDQDDLICAQWAGLSRDEVNTQLAPYWIPILESLKTYYNWDWKTGWGVQDLYDLIHNVCIPDLCNNTCDSTELECPGQPNYSRHYPGN